MNAYWIKFTDGSSGYCEGEGGFDAVRIAEHLTGKTAAVEPDKKVKPLDGEAVKLVPYPTGDMIWQHDHPIFGKTPGFCYGGARCHGRSACPANLSCTE